MEFMALTRHSWDKALMMIIWIKNNFVNKTPCLKKANTRLKTTLRTSLNIRSKFIPHLSVVAPMMTSLPSSTSSYSIHLSCCLLFTSLRSANALHLSFYILSISKESFYILSWLLILLTDSVLYNCRKWSSSRFGKCFAVRYLLISIFIFERNLVTSICCTEEQHFLHSP